MVSYRLRVVQRLSSIAVSLLRKRVTNYNSFDVVGQSVLPSAASVRAINPAEPTSRVREKPVTQRLEWSYDFLNCPDMGVFAIPHGQRRSYYWYRAANT